jgi:hypothetical protein
MKTDLLSDGTQSLDQLLKPEQETLLVGFGSLLFIFSTSSIPHVEKGGLPLTNTPIDRIHKLPR